MCIIDSMIHIGYTGTVAHCLPRHNVELVFSDLSIISVLSCIECMKCRLLLPMFAVSVSQSVSLPACLPACLSVGLSVCLSVTNAPNDSGSASLCGVIQCSLCQITLASCFTFTVFIGFNALKFWRCSGQHIWSWFTISCYAFLCSVSRRFR